MKNCIYSLLLFSFFICNAAIGQETNSKSLITIKKELKSTPRSKAKYIYENKTYKRDQLGEVIINDKLAWSYYKEYQEKKITAKRSGRVAVGFFSITLITSTIFPISVEPNAPSGSSGVEYIVVPALSTLAGLLSITMNIGSNVSANKNFDKSVRYFNGNAKNRESIGMNQMHLNLKYSQDGIGLVLNF